MCFGLVCSLVVFGAFLLVSSFLLISFIFWDVPGLVSFFVGQRGWVCSQRTCGEAFAWNRRFGNGKRCAETAQGAAPYFLSHRVKQGKRLLKSSSLTCRGHSAPPPQPEAPTSPARRSGTGSRRLWDFGRDQKSGCGCGAVVQVRSAGRECLGLPHYGL